MTATERSFVEEIAAQIGSSVMPDNRDWINRFTVESTSSSAVYTVAQRRTDGSWGCSCPGWRMHKNRKCKHLTDILHRLAVLLEKARSTFDAAALELLMSARTAYLDMDAPAVAVRVPDDDRQLDL